MKERILPRYVYRNRDRYGVTRLYFRHRGRQLRLPDDPASREFQDTYQAAMRAEQDRDRVPRVIAPSIQPKTLRWLCAEYFGSREFKALDPRTQRVRRRVVELSLLEPIKPGAPETFADCPVEFVTTRAIKVLRDRKADFPEAANARVKAFRQVFAWALDEEDYADTVKSNPARDVRYMQGSSDGFHAWTIEEVEQYEARHPVGTRARLALALLLYTGQRRSDMVGFGKQHIRKRLVEIEGRQVETEWLFFRQFKNRNRKPVDLEIPILPELREIIDASPIGDLTFLVHDLGRAFTANGFGNKMRQWCDEADLPKCSAHGLRKAATARLAELGYSDAEIMSITGHGTRKELDRYTKGVRRRKLAENVLRRSILAGS